MARVVIAAALVLCAAIAMADAARVIEYQPADAGFVGEGPAPQLAAEAVSPSGHVDVEPAVSGGGLDGDGGSVIADILWFVLRWANEAPAGDSRRKDY
ncbi:unnamed protein product [Urochloa decumbens]|uniref:Uncharacterized protein n=1 Tax=Urochloa decumbens TaxID=240449 RepID=A0ABC9E1M5_9POAL